MNSATITFQPSEIAFHPLKCKKIPWIAVKERNWLLNIRLEQSLQYNIWFDLAIDWPSNEDAREVKKSPPFQRKQYYLCFFEYSIVCSVVTPPISFLCSDYGK